MIRWLPLALATHLAVTQAAFFNNYPVDWANVPLKGDTSPKNLTANCICDTRQDVCVTDCCCSAACVNQVVNAAQSAGQCLPAGPPDQTLNYCISGASVHKVNLPSNGDFFEMSVQTADNQFIDQLLCIKSSSNPNLGNFYPDPPVGSVDNNAALVSCQKRVDISAMPTSYLFNTPVLVSLNNAARSALSLPYPVFSQTCNDQFQVGFMTSIPDGSQEQFVSCVRSTRSDSSPGTSILATLCASSPMSVGTYTSMAFYSQPSGFQATPVVVTSIAYLDPMTGLLTPLSNTNTTTEYNITEGVCHNYVSAVDMLLYYNWDGGAATGTLAQVAVSLVVTNVANTSTWLKQSSRVVWAQYQQADTRVFFTYSGNPGYLTGFPVLVGSLVTSTSTAGDKAAIQRYSNGLPLPAGSDTGMCSGSGQAPVRFGYNSTSSCWVPLTLDLLTSMCTSSPTNLAPLLSQVLDGVMVDIANNNLHLGVWGNSNTSQPSVEWVQVQISNWPPSSMAFSATDNSCSNVVVGYDLQILTGVAFAANNLQSKVLYANLCIRTATWTFPAGQTASTPAKFYMTSTVTFISKEQVMEVDVQKPAPPLLAPLPEDIFFPFITSEGSMRTASALVTALLALLLALLLAFCNV